MLHHAKRLRFNFEIHVMKFVCFFFLVKTGTTTRCLLMESRMFMAIFTASRDRIGSFP